MSDFEDKLGAILNNPQAMSQIMSLAQSLGGDSREEAPASPAVPAPAPASPGTGGPPDLSGLLGGLLGGSGESEGLNPRLLSAAMGVMSEYNRKDDHRAALLQALRPFVKEQRYAKLDKAIQIARLARLARAALDGLKGGEGSHV